jgi:hypothetical protein
MTREDILGMEVGPKLDGMIGEFVTGVMVDCYTTLPYSTDIKAAWEVVEKMRNRPGCTGCKACIEIHGTDFDNESDKPYLAFIHGQEAQGLTAPEAICKAALLVVLEEKAEV